MLVEKSFDTGEVVLNYAEGPDNGPPLVLLHALASRWQSYYPILPHIAMRWKIYVIDFRGHGKSEHTKGYKIRNYYSDTIKFIDETISDPYVLYGSSMGGWIALLIAAEHPENAKALIIGDSPLTIDYREDMMPFLSQIKTERDSAALKHSVSELAFKIKPDRLTPMTRAYAKTLIQLDPDVLTTWINAFEDENSFSDYHMGYDFEKFVKLVKCPILLLQGNSSKGGAMKDTAVEIVRSNHLDVSHVYFEEYGHDLGLSTWDTKKILRAIISFLESLR